MIIAPRPKFDPTRTPQAIAIKRKFVSMEVLPGLPNYRQVIDIAQTPWGWWGRFASKSYQSLRLAITPQNHPIHITESKD